MMADLPSATAIWWWIELYFNRNWLKNPSKIPHQIAETLINAIEKLRWDLVSKAFFVISILPAIGWRVLGLVFTAFLLLRHWAHYIWFSSLLLINTEELTFCEGPGSLVVVKSHEAVIIIEVTQVISQWRIMVLLQRNYWSHSKTNGLQKCSKTLFLE